MLLIFSGHFLYNIQNMLYFHFAFSKYIKQVNIEVYNSNCGSVAAIIILVFTHN